MVIYPRTAKGLFFLALTLCCIGFIVWAMAHRTDAFPPLPNHFVSMRPGAPKPSASEQWSDTWLWARYISLAPPLRPYWGMVWAITFGQAALRCFLPNKD